MKLVAWTLNTYQNKISLLLNGLKSERFAWTDEWLDLAWIIAHRKFCKNYNYFCIAIPGKFHWSHTTNIVKCLFRLFLILSIVTKLSTETATITIKNKNKKDDIMIIVSITIAYSDVVPYTNFCEPHDCLWSFRYDSFFRFR